MAPTPNLKLLATFAVNVCFGSDIYISPSSVMDILQYLGSPILFLDIYFKAISFFL
jgi:hypothetical protein